LSAAIDACEGRQRGSEQAQWLGLAPQGAVRGDVMHKRRFLAATLGGGALSSSAWATSSAGQGPTGPGLLTVTGAIGRGNRGPIDKALDQMMVKQQLAFERAQVFDFQMLAALPAVRIRPTLEYDAKVHELRGPLLTDVVAAAGARVADSARLVLRAVDGYKVTLGLARARRQGFIVATHLDGRPMPLGGLGPLWAVYDADRDPEMAAKPLPERFASCPWGLFHIEVLAA
jgi:hypothetical protein